MTLSLASMVDLTRRCIARVIEVQVVERSVALASLGFTAIIPLFVVVGALVPGTTDLAAALIERFHLHDGSADLVRQVFAEPDATKQAISWLGVALLVVSALSFTRAFQRIYERAWRLPARGVRGTPAGLQWLLLVVLWIGVFTSIRGALVDGLGPVVGLVVLFAGNFLIWLASPWILLSRRVEWRRLVPTAALTAAAMTILSVGSVVYMPHAIDDSAARYGPIGIAIALVSWLVAIGFVLTVSAAIGAELSDAVSSRRTSGHGE